MKKMAGYIYAIVFGKSNHIILNNENIKIL